MPIERKHAALILDPRIKIDPLDPEHPSFQLAVEQAETEENGKRRLPRRALAVTRAPGVAGDDWDEMNWFTANGELEVAMGEWEPGKGAPEPTRTGPPRREGWAIAGTARRVFHHFTWNAAKEQFESACTIRKRQQWVPCHTGPKRLSVMLARLPDPLGGQRVCVVCGAKQISAKAKIRETRKRPPIEATMSTLHWAPGGRVTRRIGQLQERAELRHLLAGETVVVHPLQGQYGVRDTHGNVWLEALKIRAKLSEAQIYEEVDDHTTIPTWGLQQAAAGLRAMTANKDGQDNE